MERTPVFIGLGGNLGDSCKTLKLALEKIRTLEGIYNLKASPFYTTTPVSPIPQPNFTNAVCKCETTYKPLELLYNLQMIEKSLGKQPKIKDAPRIIDLDILFYGTEHLDLVNLQIPHPHWKERLFVLKPLSDLITHLWVPTAPGQETFINLQILLKNFMNPHNETVLTL